IRGNDIEVNIGLSFMDAAKGCKQKITIQRLEQCESCGGSGAKKGTTAETCPDCGGSGQVRVQQRTPIGVIQTTRSCPKCGGKGKIVKEPCPDCRGMGRVRHRRTLEVSVPAGIDDGQTFVLRGQGDQGINGGPAGDVHVMVSIRPDTLFERDGFDVWCDIPVTFTQAVLGDEIEVPTIDGRVKYNMPEGTQSGTVFRLRNKGIPYVNGRGRGDQYVKVNIEVPRNLTGKQKEALKKFEELSTDRNYEKRKSFFEKLRGAMK
ncbi:MAG TPA: molecular chaperone DnaJ, partial [Candidatus Anaerotruncus excrementipullorum]|nr:molecular chaperone DnaJ [Candidatus Anaerotruncus excrementipullorum]